LTIPELRRVVLPIHPQHERVGELLWGINRLIRIEQDLAAEFHLGISMFFSHAFAMRKANGTLADLVVEAPKSRVKVGDAKGVTGEIPFFTSGDEILRWPREMLSGRYCYLNTGGNPGVKFHVGPAAYSTDTWCISGEKASTDYLYLLLNSIKSELGQKYFVGTGLRHLQKSLLLKRPIYIPDEEEMVMLNSLSTASLDSWIAHVKIANQLKELRKLLIDNFSTGQLWLTPQESLE
jgi:type I restriction enzyme S subunit